MAEKQARWRSESGTSKPEVEMDQEQVEWIRNKWRSGSGTSMGNKQAKGKRTSKPKGQEQVDQEQQATSGSGASQRDPVDQEQAKDKWIRNKQAWIRNMDRTSKPKGKWIRNTSQRDKWIRNKANKVDQEQASGSGTSKPRQVDQGSSKQSKWIRTSKQVDQEQASQRDKWIRNKQAKDKWIRNKQPTSGSGTSKPKGEVNRNNKLDWIRNSKPKQMGEVDQEQASQRRSGRNKQAGQWMDQEQATMIRNKQAKGTVDQEQASQGEVDQEQASQGTSGSGTSKQRDKWIRNTSGAAKGRVDQEKASQRDKWIRNKQAKEVDQEQAGWRSGGAKGTSGTNGWRSGSEQSKPRTSGSGTSKQQDKWIRNKWITWIRNKQAKGRSGSGTSKGLDQEQAKGKWIRNKQAKGTSGSGTSKPKVIMDQEQASSKSGTTSQREKWIRNWIRNKQAKGTSGSGTSKHGSGTSKAGGQVDQETSKPIWNKLDQEQVDQNKWEHGSGSGWIRNKQAVDLVRNKQVDQEQASQRDKWIRNKQANRNTQAKGRSGSGTSKIDGEVDEEQDGEVDQEQVIIYLI
ncbi:hypothetical protein C7M84_009562 [Penaeus vannamei]|uniref:Uncharacterized protein n=1 Tax=Penaeus vannamei TaxID=6689 RepID=A0A423T6E9_PENVA|nr:hypothetical protein C7M84_009562 [Penaeus vannamei]